MKREVEADKKAVLEVFTPGEWLSKGQILEGTGLDKVNYVLDRLIIEKKLIARGSTTSRQWALAGTPDRASDRATPAPAPIRPNGQKICV